MAAPLDPARQRDLDIGQVRLREHFLNHAELLFERVLEAAPDHPAALRFLGVARFKLGRQDEGIALLRKAADADPAARDDLAAALARRQAPDAAAFASETGAHAFKVVDYPYRAAVRYGGGRPAHAGLAALIGAGRDRYGAMLDEMAALHADFCEIPTGGRYEDAEPFWLNAWFPPLDAMALTHLLRKTNPGRFVEIGSGVSTKFARRAVSRYGLRTKLISIDPQPRNEIDALCDQILRKPLEACDPAMVEALEPGDIFFLDSSHRAFQNSDVTVFFLEILPRLKPGVLIQIHDIYLPDDYISGHLHRMWNEQYLLATALLFAPHAFEIVFPCWFVGQDPALAAHAAQALRRGPLEGLNLYGASFWMRKN